jgi:hypothetical protein
MIPVLHDPCPAMTNKDKPETPALGRQAVPFPVIAKDASSTLSQLGKKS